MWIVISRCYEIIPIGLGDEGKATITIPCIIPSIIFPGQYSTEDGSSIRYATFMAKFYNAIRL